MLDPRIVFALLLVGGFLLGSIPVGYLVARARGIDIRKVGSGNIGATNVKRALGRKLGYAVFFADMAKGLIPGLVARELLNAHLVIGGITFAAPLLWFFAGFAAFLGHMFCPWLGFKGGKGVATALGMLLAAAPAVALSCFGVFLVLLWITRYVSLASLVAAVFLPIFGLTLPGQERSLVVVFVGMALLIFVKHRDNIRRLLKGEESKFSP